MTHDDLIRQAHEWAENVHCGPTASSLLTLLCTELAGADEREKRLRAVFDAHQWDPTDPDDLPKSVENEFADFDMVMGHCRTVYSHFSNGRISKPNTLPEEVIAVAEEIQQDDWNEWLKEQTEELRATLLSSLLNRVGFEGSSGAATDTLARYVDEQLHETASERDGCRAALRRIEARFPKWSEDWKDSDSDALLVAPGYCTLTLGDLRSVRAALEAK